MTLTLKRAQRSKAYFKLGLSAPSGGGKTVGALLIAYGLLKGKYPNLPDDQIWEKIAIIDTENRSGELYVGSQIGGTKIGVYNAVSVDPPFTVDKYIRAMDLCEDSGMEVCIIDSTTHAWSGEGGLLEQQQAVASRTGNSYTAWRNITPLHNQFVNKMLQCPMHIIATVRSKQEYVQEKTDQGKSIVRKLGLEPEQRKGMEFEFTAFFEIDAQHTAFGSKDRTSIFDQQYFKITPDTGKKLWDWLSTGVTTEAEVIAIQQPQKSINNVRDDVLEMLRSLGGSSVPEVVEIVKQYTPGNSPNPNTIKDVETLQALYTALEDYGKNKETENK